FDREGPAGELARTREGGHSRSRVVHAGGDATAAELGRALTAPVRADPAGRGRRAPSRPRVVPAGGDATGAELERALTEAVRADPAVRSLEHAFLVDLLTPGGGGARAA